MPCTSNGLIYHMRLADPPTGQCTARLVQTKSSFSPQKSKQLQNYWNSECLASTWLKIKSLPCINPWFASLVILSHLLQTKLSNLIVRVLVKIKSTKIVSILCCMYATHVLHMRSCLCFVFLFVVSFNWKMNCSDLVGTSSCRYKIFREFGLFWDGSEENAVQAK